MTLDIIQFPGEDVLGRLWKHSFISCAVLCRCSHEGTNAYILCKNTPHSKQLTHLEFVLAVAQRLLASHNSRKRPAVAQPPPSSCLQRRHFLSKNGGKLQCRVCTERGQGSSHCSAKHHSQSYKPHCHHQYNQCTRIGNVSHKL